MAIINSLFVAMSQPIHFFLDIGMSNFEAEVERITECSSSIYFTFGVQNVLSMFLSGIEFPKTDMNVISWET